MSVYRRYMVVVEAASAEQCDQVIQERVFHDEDYGFDYTIDVEDSPGFPREWDTSTKAWHPRGGEV